MNGGDEFGKDTFIYYRKNHSSAIFENMGHIAVIVETKDGKYYLRDSGFKKLRNPKIKEKLPILNRSDEALIRLPNKDLGDGKTSDGEILKYLKNGKTGDKVGYCSTYGVNAVKAGGYDLGSGIIATPNSIKKKAAKLAKKEDSTISIIYKEETRVSGGSH